LAFSCWSLLSHTLSFVWFRGTWACQFLSLNLHVFLWNFGSLFNFVAICLRIFIKPLDHVLLPTELVKKWGRSWSFLSFILFFCIPCCGLLLQCVNFGFEVP
jgi:hypothetical protein